jgi:hypothetical protein
MKTQVTHKVVLRRTKEVGAIYNGCFGRLFDQPFKKVYCHTSPPLRQQKKPVLFGLFRKIQAQWLTNILFYAGFQTAASFGQEHSPRQLQRVPSALRCLHTTNTPRAPGATGWIFFPHFGQQNQTLPLISFSIFTTYPKRPFPAQCTARGQDIV